MKRFFVLVFALMLVLMATNAFAWRLISDAYIPAADGSVGIPSSFVYRIDGGAEVSIPATVVTTTNYPVTPPTGGWPSGTVAFILNVDSLRGNHSAVAKAVNAAGESVYSSPFPFTVPVVPVVPPLQLVR